jgi:hypothetical protein
MDGAEKVPHREEDWPEIRRRFRAFMDRDDGKPIYSLNVMRYRPKLDIQPGYPNFSGTPQEANAYYERSSIPFVLRVGAYPAFVGNNVGENVTVNPADQDKWNRVLLVYYPSRRAFMEFVTSKGFQDIAAYKFMAVDALISPAEAEVVLPSPTLLAGSVFLMIFLAFGWWRAARVQRTVQAAP